MNKPLVSVCMITYNHESYIKEALEGVLMQQCDFNLEVILCNDASTDETDKVIKETWRDTKTKTLQYINHKKNIGMIPNFMVALQKCNGAYIAICEGDDYWTDPFKLQKQINFLKVHPSYALCFHNVQIYNDDTKKFEVDTITRSVKKTTTLNDIAKGNYIHTPSVVLRNTFTLPDWFTEVYLGDWSLYMITVGEKKIKKFPETMAVYRISGGAAWSTQSKNIRKDHSRKTVAIVAKNAQIPDVVISILTSRLSSKKAIEHTKSTFKKSVVKLLRPLYRFLFAEKTF